MALSILVFDFYPITPLMIILLALLNDIPILTVAYDHTRVLPHPVRWRMKRQILPGTSQKSCFFGFRFTAWEGGFRFPLRRVRGLNLVGESDGVSGQEGAVIVAWEATVS